MYRSRLAPCVLLLLLLPGCAVSYSFWRTGERTYEVSARWSQSAQGLVTDCLLLLSAQVTDSAGYRHFVITRAERDSATVTRSGTRVATPSKTGGWKVSQKPPTTTSAQTQSYEIEMAAPPSLQTQLSIAEAHGLPQEEVFVYDAEFLERALVEQAGVECPFARPPDFGR